LIQRLQEMIYPHIHSFVADAKLVLTSEVLYFCIHERERERERD